MTHQLSRLSPEMTGVRHRSMLLPSVVCGLGLAPVSYWGKKMFPQEQ